MLAIQFSAKEQKLSLKTIPSPLINEKNEVVIRVAYAGVCGTDLHIVEGAFPCSESAITLGHEFCGVVSSVGSDVKHVKPGDNVVLDPESGCNTCDYCHNGNYHYCKTGALNNAVGIYRHGGWAQFCKVPAEQVHKLPPNIPLERAVLTEPLSCIAHGWDIASPLPVGSKILILGSGIIGNLWVSILHLQGHRDVIVSEPKEGRRELVKNLDTGFDIVSPAELKAYRTRDPDWGVDLVIDCSGYVPAMEEAVTYLNPGGKLCMFGVSSPDAKMRYLTYEKLGIKIFSLKEYNEALQCLKKGTISKAVFKME
ncbi:uncharacterized protein [Periplaneta americana]|uniref:uncharacterized protein isoform X2 n=1 Tax=Periplaneta americana TaxID=6978 RepID=UPI0037E87CF9